MKDLNYCIRQIFKRKSYSATIIVTIAVCVGLNLLVFNIINALFFNTGLSKHEDRIARVYDTYSNQIGNLKVWGTSPQLYLERREHSDAFEEIGMYVYDDVNLSLEGGGLKADFRTIYRATPSLFKVFEEEPLLGRLFEESEGEPGGNNHVVILTHQYWKSQLKANPNVIGMSLWMDSVPHEIVGVMPEHFDIPSYTSDARRDGIFKLACFVPFVFWDWHRSDAARIVPYFGCYARLNPGGAPEDLERELNLLNASMGPLHPEAHEREKALRHRTRVTTLGEDLVRNSKSLLVLVQGGLLLLLVVGCSSVSAVIFGRNIERFGEMATRAALGASRFQVVRPLLLEICVLVSVGALIGLALAFAGQRLVSAFGFLDIFVIDPRISFNLTAASVAAGMAFLIAAVVALLSVYPIATKSDLNSVIKDHSRVGTSRAMNVYKGNLLFIQVAVSAALLVGGGLLYRSFTKISEIDPGFDTRHIMTAAVRLPESGYDDAARREFMTYLRDEMAAQPYVQAVGICNWIPLKLFSRWERDLLVEGSSDPSNSGTFGRCTIDMVYGDFFQALGIKFLKGRPFLPSEYENQMPVAIIDERVAETHFGNENPVGRRIATSGPNAEGAVDWLEIVGVVEAIKTNSLTTHSAIGGRVFMNAYRSLPFSNGMVIKTQSRNELGAALAALRQALDNRDPHLGIILPESMEQIIHRNYKDQKNLMIVVSVIAFVALLLSALGIYGSIDQSVASSSKEIGIRRALGASGGDLLWGSMRFWIKAAFAGLVFGLGLAALLSAELSEMLYEVTHLDASTYAFVFVFLAMIVMGSAFISARRSTRLDPAVALREE